jgi:hypothetical protein
MSTLRALYLDNNDLTSLPDGDYLSGLRVLGIDWRLLASSHTVLRRASKLRKICLMSFGTAGQVYTVSLC